MRRRIVAHNKLDLEQPLDSNTWEAINDFSLWLHAQHELEDIQRGSLERIGNVIPHRISMFDLVKIRADNQAEYTNPVSTTMEQAELDAYYQRYAAMDYTTWSFDLHALNVYRDLDLVDVELRDRTPIFLEWMEPQGVYFGCGATLAADTIPLGTVTLFRERSAGDFTGNEMRILKELARHLSLRLHELYPSGIVEKDSGPNDPIASLVEEAGINPREAEILRLMIGGCTNKQMAAALFISESTVKKHVNAIYHKLGVSNRMGLAAFVQQIGKHDA